MLAIAELVGLVVVMALVGALLCWVVDLWERTFRLLPPPPRRRKRRESCPARYTNGKPG